MLKFLIYLNAVRLKQSVEAVLIIIVEYVQIEQISP